MNKEKSFGVIAFTIEDHSIKYLLVRSLRRIYGFPKGHMEHGEKEEETAMREVWEETGLVPSIIPGFKTRDVYLLPNGNEKEVIYFLGLYKEGIPTPQISEISEIVLKKYEDALELFQFESHRRMLKEANDYLLDKKNLLNGYSVD